MRYFIIFFLIIATLFFSGCYSPSAEKHTYHSNYAGYTFKANQGLENEEEENYQEMYEEGLGGETEEIEYE